MDTYGKCGGLDSAKRVLDYMSDRDSVSWNSVITDCTVNGMVYVALELLERMLFEESSEMLKTTDAKLRKRNPRLLQGMNLWLTLINGLLNVYRRCRDMESALKIFSEFSMKNAGSFNTMIVGYCSIGEIPCTKELFNRIELAGVKKDIISWNSMISGYVDNFMFNEALNMFRDLLMDEGIKTNYFTSGSALTACANKGSVKQGKVINAHAIARGLESNPFGGGALVEMYCKCRDLKAAQMAFDLKETQQHGML
ncbi:hypothetical protein LguiA_024211 [Lonicera macranthoides]